jgi:acetylornithine deacetylase/succinyl-diaminopimelate desuccinylase-like protein
MRFPATAERKPDDRTTGPAAFALDGDQKTAWTNERDPARNNDPAVLTFELPEPFKTGGTIHFNYNLSMNHGGFNSDDTQTYNLGRVRVSVSATLPNALDNLPPLVREALETPASAPVVTTATSVLRSMRLDDRPCGVPFGSDASKLSRAGIPAIVFGPGRIDQAHAADEYVEVAQVKQAMEFYRRFILDFGA